MSTQAIELVETEEPGVQTLDDLASLSSEELDCLYRASGVPKSLKALDGDPEGRMLAIRSADRGMPADGLRRFARSSIFPWGGKSFSADTANKGSGINRIQVVGRWKLFPFETAFTDSAIDGEKCIVLNYDLPKNPLPIRMIHDELREVAPGLFLGPACWKTRSGPKLVLWFALDTNSQAAG